MKKAIAILALAAVSIGAAALAGCNVGSHTHEFINWGNDDNYHWHKCKTCGAVEEGSKALHVIRTDNTCECGYALVYTETLEFTEIHAEDGVTVTGYAVSGIPEGESVTDLIIPNYHNGKPVTEILDEAFKDCSEIVSVIIPATVEKIGESAFWCVGFKSIELPENLTEIGKYAFAGCESLESITIGSSVNSVGTQAFNGCTGLQSVEINCTGASFGNYAFVGCTSLKTCTINGESALGSDCFYYCDQGIEIIVGDEVENIPQLAFDGGDEIKKLTLPKSIKSIGAGAFSGCQIEKVNYKGSINDWAQIDFKSSNASPFYAGYQKDCKAVLFIDGKEVKGTVNLAAEEINSYAFYNYSKNFTAVILENTVKTVGRQAFACETANSTLTSLVILSKTLTTLAQSFYFCQSMNIYYNGTYNDMYNGVLTDGTLNVHSFAGCMHYFYSEDGTYEPAQNIKDWKLYGGTWHYDIEGNIAVW